jgi:hypothetical protein
MKRTILLLGLLCMGFQCGDDYDLIANHGEWWVKNDSAKTVLIRHGAGGLVPVELVPGASTMVVELGFDIVEMPRFASMVKGWGKWAAENIAFEVLDTEGTRLAKWNYTEKENPGRQFFNESTWISTQTPGDRIDEVRVRWFFEITEGDIQQSGL